MAGTDCFTLVPQHCLQPGLLETRRRFDNLLDEPTRTPFRSILPNAASVTSGIAEVKSVPKDKNFRWIYDRILKKVFSAF